MEKFANFIGKHLCWILSPTQVFSPWNLWNFWEHLFWRTYANDCFHIFIIILIINYLYHHFHYYCKMHLNHLGVILPIAFDCNMSPCLFQLNLFSFFRHIFFFSVIASFSFFMPSKRTQNSFTTSRQILDVLIFVSIVI